MRVVLAVKKLFPVWERFAESVRRNSGLHVETGVGVGWTGAVSGSETLGTRATLRLGKL